MSQTSFLSDRCYGTCVSQKRDRSRHEVKGAELTEYTKGNAKPVRLTRDQSKVTLNGSQSMTRIGHYDALGRASHVSVRLLAKRAPRA